MGFNDFENEGNYKIKSRRNIIASANINNINNYDSFKKAVIENKTDIFAEIEILQNENEQKPNKKKKRKVALKIKRAISAALSFIIIASGTAFASNIRVGYEVYINNKSMGIIEDKDEAKLIVEKIKKELDSTEGLDFEDEPIFNPRFAMANKIISNEEIEINIKNLLDYYVDGCRILIDDDSVVNVENEEIANTLIEEYKNSILGEGTIQSYEVLSKIEIKPDKVLSSSVKDSSEAMEIINGIKGAKESFYTVQEKDTLWDIAVKHDLPVSYLLSINKDLGDVLKIGQQIYLKAPQPLIKIKIIEKLSYEETIPFEITQQNDKNMQAGKIEILQKGSDGKRHVEAIIERINNEETSREILKEEIYYEPVNQIEKIGTKKSEGLKATGKFLRPVSGSISSSFGKRGRETHTGIDYACAYGVSIKAADSGKVVQVGTYGGYGKMVKIEHNNGYQTLYAHCSSLNVKVGQNVKKGEIIAKVGSTGRSTGPHLHFEIRKNGVPQNPAKYV